MSSPFHINYPTSVQLPVESIGLGVFDGYHRGHQAIGEQVDGLLTFFPHPAQVLKKGFELRYLSTVEELRCYYPQTFVVDFTPGFAKLSALDFLELILKDTFHVKRIVVGHDYCFGHNREGDVAFLERWCHDEGIELTVIEEVMTGDEKIRSSIIRKELEHGDANKAIDLLGHPYLIIGKVCEGEQRGRKLGFPTANLSVGDDKCIPHFGVYKGYVTIEEQSYKAMIYIGDKPTFHGQTKSIEVHILNFSDDIYGKNVHCYISKKIRDQQQFSSEDELVKQIKADIQEAYA